MIVWQRTADHFDALNRTSTHGGGELKLCGLSAWSFAQYFWVPKRMLQVQSQA